MMHLSRTITFCKEKPSTVDDDVTPNMRSENDNCNITADSNIFKNKISSEYRENGKQHVLRVLESSARNRKYVILNDAENCDFYKHKHKEKRLPRHLCKLFQAKMQTL